MNITTKTIAGVAVAALLMPTLAFAHGTDSKANASFELRIQKGVERAENKDSHDDHKSERYTKHATTTAAAITKKATRVQLAADTITSFNTRIAALIASSSADVKAGLETKFTEYKADAASAKVEAQAAIAGAAQVNASNSTTTNATLLAQAKVDLKESKGFLHDAKEALFSILRILWK